MKKFVAKDVIIVTLSALVLVLSIMTVQQPKTVHAQTAAMGAFGPIVVGSVSACAEPTWSTIASGVSLCFVNTGTPSTSGLYFALNGGTTWTQIGGVGVGVSSFNGQTGAVTGVASFNGQTGAVTGVASFAGRTGAVVPAESDYTNLLKYSDLAAQPTTVNCGSTGCVIK